MNYQHLHQPQIIGSQIPSIQQDGNILYVSSQPQQMHHKRNGSSGGSGLSGNLNQYHSRNNSVGFIANPSWDISGASAGMGVMPPTQSFIDNSRNRQNYVSRKGLGTIGPNMLGNRHQ